MAETPTESPTGTPIQPMHNPAQAAHVVVPQAPLGNATNGQYNQLPGMGAKALLAKKFAKTHNPTYVSPTDNMMTPCSQKLNQTKKKHFTKGVAKPMPSLFSQQADASSESDSEESSPQNSTEPSSEGKMAEDENPF
ncbi:hypothetical protein BD309DRAFT_986811 [Dichomitus squalens]|uniref:Spo12 family-domain-containing protein n=1 Tax=Dichomitus squalens TaxID=114155 RepID=A0A4Q9MZR8_9APHY|nr:uncharacterized protein DICSQDRAFT_154059 [Dichomitus squalens LYAD-421 SS1]EJF62798.1 hypothetical protein DICSQDRAFT_154059 [Dichomitus squalens LYAD-421 SS1]TBU32968.1 hypothetical protein BD311DRAFT_785571 [Dichomitus squalens]TBU49001.1 hypothetical protein BD309DRAFT_986811 [Dichomitus squalens]TBU64094.1 hypothetical protein BD310DRAFT_944598 [Dichomitus squalens]